MERLVLRPFAEQDWVVFAGAEGLDAEHPPLVYDDGAILVLADNSSVEVHFSSIGDQGYDGYALQTGNYFVSKAVAEALINLDADPLDEDLLRKYGFYQI